MSYGNGQIFSQTLTPRLQPLRQLSEMGVHKPLDQAYSYDPRGKVTSIVKGDIPSDSRDGNEPSTNMPPAGKTTLEQINKIMYHPRVLV